MNLDEIASTVNIHSVKDDDFLRFEFPKSHFVIDSNDLFYVTSDLAISKSKFQIIQGNFPYNELVEQLYTLLKQTSLDPNVVRYDFYVRLLDDSQPELIKLLTAYSRSTSTKP